MIITLQKDKVTTNFKVNEEQRIYDVLKTILDNTSLYNNCTHIRYVTSKRRREKINVLKTFQEAQILNGDTLIIGGTNNE